MVGADPVSRFEASAQVAQRAIDALSDQDWRLPSTCEGWTVETLVRHLVQGNERLASSLGVAPRQPVGAAPDTWSERHRASVESVATGLRRPGALDGTVTVPAGTLPGVVVAGLRTVEALVHGWDVSTSTGRRAKAPEELVTYAEGLTRQLLERLPTDRRPFKPATDPPPGATPLDRLAALLGRRVPGPG